MSMNSDTSLSQRPESVKSDRGELNLMAHVCACVVFQPHIHGSSSMCSVSAKVVSVPPLIEGDWVINSANLRVCCDFIRKTKFKLICKSIYDNRISIQEISDSI